MPHLTLEYSNNLPQTIDFTALFHQLHAALTEFPPIKLGDIKSRAISYSTFVAGAGAPESIFVHLTVAVFNGRSIEERKKMGQKLLVLVEEAFHQTFLIRPCDITVDIREMERGVYSKLMNDQARQVSQPK